MWYVVIFFVETSLTYTDYGLAQFKIPDVLKLSPIEKHGNIKEIATIFGGPEELIKAIERLQSELYAA